MPEKAHVSSLDALEEFRSHLIIYLSKARPALEEVSADVTRMRLWLENDQKTHWQSETRRRAKDLEEAQAALFSARLSSFGKGTAVEQMQAHRAKRAMDEAEVKMRLLKKWDREFESRVLPLVKQTDKLHTVLCHDMQLAVAYLTQAINKLAAYAGVKAPAPPTSASSAEKEVNA